MADILLNQEVETALKKNLAQCINDVNIISAFCKISTLKYIDSFIKSGVKKRLLVRFLPSDLASGATDKDIFDYCLKHNWKLYFDPSIHAKTYIFDKINSDMASYTFRPNN